MKNSVANDKSRCVEKLKGAGYSTAIIARVLQISEREVRYLERRRE